MTDRAVQRLEAARAAFDRGDFAAAERRARQGLEALQRATGGEAHELRIEAWLLLAAVFTETRVDDRAIEALAQAYQLAPGDGEATYLEARLRLLRWELDAAELLLERCEPPADLAGAVLYHRAIVAELHGRFAAAERFYARAAELDPEGCPRPVRMRDDEAQALLAELVASFPAEVRAALANLRIELVDLPDPKIDRGQDTDPLVLGLYHGVPIGDKTGTGVALPDTVRIFKRSIERLAADRDELIAELRITLLHEVGHHLGWDEDDLEARGLG